MSARFGEAAELVGLIADELSRQCFFAAALHRASTGHQPPEDGRPAWWACLAPSLREIADELVRLGVWQVPA